MAMTGTEIEVPTDGPPAGVLKCRIVDDLAGIVRLQAGWESLSPALRSPMETFGWSAAAAAGLSEAPPPQFLVAEHHGSIRAIAPLAACRGLAFGRLEMLGMDVLNEPGDLIYADHESLHAVVRRAVAFGRPIVLGRLPAESPTIKSFQQAAKGRGKVIVRRRPSCPYVPLDESWLEPERHLSSRRRSDLRRARRRAEQQGDVRGEIISPTPRQVDSLLDTAFTVEARSWKGATGTALSNDPVRGGHLRRFAFWASGAGILRLCLLHIGDATAAMQIAVEHNSALWLLKIGFDPEFAICSPGNLLLAESIRYAVNRKLISLEFLGTVEPWTRVWTEHERKCVSLRYYPFNFHGAAGFLSDSGANLVRRMRSHRSDKTTGHRHDNSVEPSDSGEPANNQPADEPK
jgi:CelD/BcsL family acetyltransferase involved in cellulose biosynthesis